jgi:hypothetical protein
MLMATWLGWLIYGIGYCCAVVPTARMFHEPTTNGLFSTPRAAFAGGIMVSLVWPLVLVGWLIWKAAGLLVRLDLLAKEEGT